MVVMLGCKCAPAAEFHETIAFREPLGHTWTDELVHYDVRPADGRVAAATFWLADADGKPVPFQVEVVEGKPEAVRRARVWLKLTLQKDQQVFYRLTWNDEGRAAAPPEGKPIARRDGDRVVLSTGVAEAAVAAPAKPPAEAVDLRAAPPPILGVRPEGDKTWYGNWALAGAARVREIKTTIEAAGPLWAEVRLKYVLENRGQNYDVTVRAVRGEPWFDVLEKYHLAAEAQATLTLADPLKVAEVLWMPWFVGRDGRVEPAYDVHRLRLTEKLQTEKALATLRPKWSQIRDASQWCVAAGAGDGRPAVGVVMTCPGDWLRPYDQFVSVRALAGGRGVAMEFPLGEGRRHWALLAGPADRFDSKAELQLLMRRLADIPLDRVLSDWVLQWPRDAGNPGPHILTTWPRVQEIRQDVADDVDSPAAMLVKRVLAGELPGDRKLAEFLAGRRDDVGGGLDAATVLDRAYQDETLSPPAYSRRLAAAMRLADLSAAGKPAGGAAAAFLAYVFSDPNYWPGAAAGWDVGNPGRAADIYTIPIYAAAMMPDHPHARKWMAGGLAALHDDLNRLCAMPEGVGIDGPGEQAAALAPMLALIRTAQNCGLDDPFAWSAGRLSLEYLRNLHTPPDPRLGRRGLAPIGDAAPWQDGVGSLFGIAAAGARKADPKASAAWMAMYREYYGTSGSGDLARDVLLSDPSAPAARLEDAAWTSRRYTGFGAVLRSRFGTAGETFATFKCGPARGNYHGDELSFHFFGAAQPVALDWACGRTPRIEQEHMHNRVTLGDYENMDAVGELVAMEFSPAGDAAVGQVRSDRLRMMPHYPHELGRGAALSRRTLPSESRYRRFLLLVKHDRPGETSTADRRLEDYLVIRDELVSTEPATFNLFALARSVRQDGRTFIFDGQLAADALLYLATPEPERVKLDRWSWPKQDDSSMIPKDFRTGLDRWRTGELQQWVRVTESPGRPFLAVLYPYRKGQPVPEFQPLAGGKGVRVTLGDAAEDIYLATDPAPEAGGQAVVRRGPQATVILKPRTVPAL